MSVDKQTVARIAHLARIKVPEEALEPITGDLNNILAWVEQLGEVNTDGVEPMTSPSQYIHLSYGPAVVRPLRVWNLGPS